MDIDGKEYFLQQISNGVASAHDIKSSWNKFILLFQGLNNSFSENNFVDFLNDNENKIFFIKKKSDGCTVGIIGLRFIDFLQKRAELVLITDKENQKIKMLYEPLKILLIKAVNEWSMRKIVTYLYKDDVYTPTILKGFGFKQEGIFTEYVDYEGSYCDVTVYGLNRNNFHAIEV